MPSNNNLSGTKPMEQNKQQGVEKNPAVKPADKNLGNQQAKGIPAADQKTSR